MREVRNRFTGESMGELDISPGANLTRADLRGANLSGANLTRADLRGANLSGADLRGADLRGANLSGADLRGAYLSGADLRRANLYEADLSGAYLRGAKWDEKTVWPAPTMLLLAAWGVVKDKLCVELMRFDVANHPDPSAFDDWANGGKCPYADCQWPRCANFKESRNLWRKYGNGPALSPLGLCQWLFGNGPALSPLGLCQWLLAEKCVFVEERE